MVYAVHKLEILFGYEDYKVQISHFDLFYNDTSRFQNNFMVAAGIPTGFDGQAHTGVPKDIGALKFYRKNWTPGSSTDFDEIPTRPCTRADFDWGEETDNSEALFFPTEKSIFDLENHWRDMICPIDVNDIYSSGNYDS